MSAPLKSVMAERVHPFFTASPHYPVNMPLAWEDGKQRMRQSLESQVAALADLTLQDYCHATGSNLLG